MAVLALGVAGAAAGYGVGLGASLTGSALTTAIGVGWSVGTIAGQYLFGPSIPENPDIVQEGPRLGDTILKGGSYGQSIARVWGQDRIAGGVIWKQPIREEIQTEVIGGGDSGGGKGGKGGGGGGSTTITNYYYYGSFAIQLCEGPVSIRRIWMNSKLVRDPDNSRTELDQFMTFYSGTDSQLPDPVMESYEGAGNVPGYRNVAYIVFDDLPLADFNNQVPNIEVEVVTEQQAPAFLLEAKTFTHTSPGGRTADRLTYIDGSDVWAISELTLGDVGGNLAITYTSARYSLETGAVLETNNDVTAVTDIVLANMSLPNPSAEYVTNGPYIYGLGRFAGGEIGDPVFPEVPGTAYCRIAVIDIRSNTWLNSYAVPTGPEAGENETYGGGWYDGLYIYLVRSRVGIFTPSRMPYPFGTQGQLQYGYLDLSGTPEIQSRSAEVLIQDGTIAYVLWADDTIGRYSWENNEMVWLALPQDHPGLIPFSVSPRRTNIQNNIMFTPTSIENHEFLSFAIGSETGELTRLERETNPPIPGNDGWEFNCIFGRDRAIGSGGIWQAFAYTYDNQVSDIIDEACDRSGLLSNEYDTSLIQLTILGYIRAAPMSGRALIQALQRILAFDAVETDGTIRFVPQDDQSGQTGLTILADDLGAHMYGTGAPDEIRLTRAQELEMPREIRVRYKSLAQDYDAGVAKIPNPVTPSRDAVTIELPAVLEETQAKNIARRFLNQTLWNRITANFSVPTKLIALEPTDIVTVSTPAGDYEIRLTTVGLTAPSVLTFEGNVTAAEIYDLDETSDQISAPPATLPPIVASFVGHLDIPVMREADAPFEGHYSYGWGPGVTPWPGATLYLTGAMGLWIVGTYWSEGKEATHGSVTAPAGDLEHPFQWDDVNAVTVQLTRGTLQSSTDQDVQAGANTAAVGIDGRWEIIGFVDVVDNGNGSYTLSRLMRARRGTEHNVGTGQAGDTFVLLDEIGLRRVNTPTGSTGQQVTYRYVPANDRLANVSNSFYTTDGTSLTPFAPWRIEGQRDGVTNDLTVRWTQRSRCSIEGYLGEDYATCETIDQHHVEFRLSAGGAILRTLVVDDVDEAIYSLAAYRVDSGDSGAAVIPTLHVTVYQISSVVGRGYPGETTV